MNTIESSGIKRLTGEDFIQISQFLNCDSAVLKAVHHVETEGRGGFFAPGKPVIRFVGYIFWRQLKKLGLNPAEYVSGNEDVLYPMWEKGHYKGVVHEYALLERSRKIHIEAADSSTSWGMFQIMGSKYAAYGEPDVESFVQNMCDSEYKQLLLFANFIKNNPRMLVALQTKSVVTFSKYYNGPDFTINRYGERLMEAYRLFKDCERE